MQKDKCEILLKNLIKQYVKKEIPCDMDISSINLITDLGIDSFTFIQLLVDIEEIFHINIEDDPNIEELIIWDNLVEFIAKQNNLEESNV